MICPYTLLSPVSHCVIVFSFHCFNGCSGLEQREFQIHSKTKLVFKLQDFLKFLGPVVNAYLSYLRQQITLRQSRRNSQREVPPNPSYSDRDTARCASPSLPGWLKMELCWQVIDQLFILRKWGRIHWCVAQQSHLAEVMMEILK